MPDRDKIIERLEECFYGSCRGYWTCPFSDNEWDTTLALLREQETTPEAVGDESAYGGTWHYECASCHGAIDYKDKFCRHCGRKVKWDGA